MRKFYIKSGIPRHFCAILRGNQGCKITLTSIKTKMYEKSINCRFSHDVTKIQNKKLSILPRFYVHDALEQLKTNFHTNFRFKRILGFVIEYD